MTSALSSSQPSATGGGLKINTNDDAFIDIVTLSPKTQARVNAQFLAAQSFRLYEIPNVSKLTVQFAKLSISTPSNFGGATASSTATSIAKNHFGNFPMRS